ncbi:unnamed protein product [Linum tenue]|uniref:Uncharacterized protein n=1 Tax=Linum tenue TaxID=586396 RepID=A0AAV0L1V5_9ROSI|nr:unnamed protein product [Linum tenue]
MMMEKSKSFSGGYSEMSRAEFEDKSKSDSFNGPTNAALGTSDKAGDFADENPETERRKRVAQYNIYSTEGKLKSSLRNSFKWIKSKFVDDYFQD